MSFETKLGLHHVILFAWLGLFVGAISEANLGSNMGWIEWARVIGFLSLLFFVVGFYSWRNRTNKQQKLEKVE